MPMIADPGLWFFMTDIFLITDGCCIYWNHYARLTATFAALRGFTLLIMASTEECVYTDNPVTV
jgi:hypothetical protein